MSPNQRRRVEEDRRKILKDDVKPKFKAKRLCYKASGKKQQGRLTCCARFRKKGREEMTTLSLIDELKKLPLTKENARFYVQLKINNLQALLDDENFWKEYEVKNG